jgi:hypothetical protein
MGVILITSGVSAISGTYLECRKRIGDAPTASEPHGVAQRAVIGRSNACRND